MARGAWINSMIKRISFLVLIMVLLSGGVFAEGERVGIAEVTVCCEKTNSGLYCQDVLESECSSDSEFALPTACESTGPCDPGYCFDSEEGTCLDNVPKRVCDDNDGQWFEEQPEMCNLGCCVLGDQAAFVTGIRCKRLSAFYGLETNFDSEINNEALCILSARADEDGACIYKSEYGDNTCERLSRSECDPEKLFDLEEELDEEGNLFEDAPEESEESGDEETGEEVMESPLEGCENLENDVRFCPGMLCSAEELDNECGPSEETTCVDGKEEVYFVDTCGNIANIYDADRVNDDVYWKYIVDKSEACEPDRPNIDSQTCGNCNYLLGSFCSATSSQTASPTYGGSVCIDLNCEASEMTGEVDRLHGESWCLFDSERDFTYEDPGVQPRVDLNIDFKQKLQKAMIKVKAGGLIGSSFRGEEVPVGSKFYRYICSHGEVIVEPCADFRQETCIENEAENGYTSAACRVNRWQDCTTQYTKSNCENGDQRDCMWLDGIQYVLFGGLANGTNLDKSSLQAAKGELKKLKGGEREFGGCVPKTAPGLQFWSTEEEKADGEGGGASEAASICSQANAMCPVTYEKGIGGDWECIENCECLEKEAELARAQVCMALGDCGPKVNYLGQNGRTTGYRVFEGGLKDGK